MQKGPPDIFPRIRRTASGVPNVSAPICHAASGVPSISASFHHAANAAGKIFPACRIAGNGREKPRPALRRGKKGGRKVSRPSGSVATAGGKLPAAICRAGSVKRKAQGQFHHRGNASFFLISQTFHGKKEGLRIRPSAVRSLGDGGRQQHQPDRVGIRAGPAKDPHRQTAIAAQLLRRLSPRLRSEPFAFVGVLRGEIELAGILVELSKNHLDAANPTQRDSRRGYRTSSHPERPQQPLESPSLVRRPPQR